MERKYLIYSFDYATNAPGGVKTLHAFCNELNKAGKTAFVTSTITNPNWNTPFYGGPVDDDWIAVYPEVVPGNLLKAKYIARWLLNIPGKLGGDKTYDPNEIVFYYHPSFNTLDLSPDRLLYLLSLEIDIYIDRHEKRFGTAYYIGKGQRTQDLANSIRITSEIRSNPQQLADLLNSIKLLYTFDNVTAIKEIAMLCGCPVCYISDDKYIASEPFNSTIVRQEYFQAYEEFKSVQLPNFIRLTQN